MISHSHGNWPRIAYCQDYITKAEAEAGAEAEAEYGAKAKAKAKAKDVAEDKAEYEAEDERSCQDGAKRRNLLCGVNKNRYTDTGTSTKAGLGTGHRSNVV